MGIKKNLDKNYQLIAEERTSKKYPNCEVLNSYYVAKDKEKDTQLQYALDLLRGIKSVDRGAKKKVEAEAEKKAEAEGDKKTEAEAN